jgi:uncharacterized protein (DUF4415 family)
MVHNGHHPDAENPEWTDDDFARAKPASDVHGSEIASSLVRKGGRPPKPVAERKRQVTLRFAPELLEALRSSGPGWQTRVEQVLRREFLGGSDEKPNQTDFEEAVQAAALMRARVEEALRYNLFGQWEKPQLMDVQKSYEQVLAIVRNASLAGLASPQTTVLEMMMASVAPDVPTDLSRPVPMRRSISTRRMTSTWSGGLSVPKKTG